MADPIKLPPKMDLPAAMPLMVDLRGADGDIVLDASDVTHLGALCLQVLISGARTAQEAGHDFRIENLNQAVTDQLGFMGVSPDNLARSVE